MCIIADLEKLFSHNNNISTERWPSGLRCTLGKRVYSKRVPRVRIPPSPHIRACFNFIFWLRKCFFCPQISPFYWHIVPLCTSKNVVFENKIPHFQLQKQNQGSFLKNLACYISLANCQFFMTKRIWVIFQKIRIPKHLVIKVGMSFFLQKRK